MEHTRQGQMLALASRKTSFKPCELSSYTKIYSVIYDSGLIPDSSIFPLRGTSPTNAESIIPYSIGSGRSGTRPSLRETLEKIHDLSEIYCSIQKGSTLALKCSTLEFRLGGQRSLKILNGSRDQRESGGRIQPHKDFPVKGPRII